MNRLKISNQDLHNSVSFRKEASPPAVRMEARSVIPVSRPITSLSQHPTLKWAQRHDLLLLTIDLPNAKDVKLRLEPEGRFYFSATRGIQNVPYEVDINLYGNVNVNESKASIGLRSIVYLVQKEQRRWWRRLLKREGRTPSFIEIDLDRWEDGEEELDEPGLDNQIVKGQDFENKARKKLNGLGIFGCKYEAAGELYEVAANCYKLARFWNQAGAMFVEAAQCYLKGTDGKLEAANAFAEAGHAYKETNQEEFIACLEQAFDLFMDIGRLRISARYCKEIAQFYASVRNWEQAISYYSIAADLFQGEEVTTSYLCKQEIAQISALEGQYNKAIGIYEEMARECLKNNLLKDRVKGHLLNAGICLLCADDGVAIANALVSYQELDPTFSNTPEFGSLAHLAAALDEEDVIMFRYACEVSGITEQPALDEEDVIIFGDAGEVSGITEQWKKTLLLRVEERLWSVDEDHDLT